MGSLHLHHGNPQNTGEIVRGRPLRTKRLGRAKRSNRCVIFSIHWSTPFSIIPPSVPHSPIQAAREPLQIPQSDINTCVSPAVGAPRSRPYLPPAVSPLRRPDGLPSLPYGDATALRSLRLCCTASRCRLCLPCIWGEAFAFDSPLSDECCWCCVVLCLYDELTLVPVSTGVAQSDRIEVLQLVRFAVVVGVVSLVLATLLVAEEGLFSGSRPVGTDENGSSRREENGRWIFSGEREGITWQFCGI